MAIASVVPRKPFAPVTICLHGQWCIPLFGLWEWGGLADDSAIVETKKVSYGSR